MASETYSSLAAIVWVFGFISFTKLRATMVRDNSQSHKKQELTVADVLKILWTGRFVVVLVSLTSAVTSVLFSLSIPNQYTSVAVLAPAQSESSGLAGAMRQLGGLASLAGVNFSKGSSSESTIAQRVMTSWSFIESFIDEHDLAVDLIAARDWDQASDTLILDREIYDPVNRQWFLNDSEGAAAQPTSWDLYQQFAERLSVSEDSETGLVTVSFEFYSPNIARDWLTKYISDVNTYMQRRQISKVQRNLEYLAVQVSQTSLAELQEAFYAITEEQLKSQMLAEASPEYAFITVSPAMTPQEKSGPKRALICLLGTLFGILLACFAVLARHILSVERAG